MRSKIYVRTVAALIVFTVCAALIFANSNTWKNRKQRDNSRAEITYSSSREIIESSIPDTSETSAADTSISSEPDSSEPTSIVESIPRFESSTVESCIESVAEEIQVVNNAVVEENPDEVIVVTKPNIQRLDDTPHELGEAIAEEEPVLVEDNKGEVLAETPTDYVAADYTPYELYNQGRLYWGDYQYTWYSERVLPGYGLAIDGRHTDSDGFVCDGDGYICVASGSLSKGTVVDTPFGRQGKVYDCGCDWSTIDVYVNW